MNQTITEVHNLPALVRQEALQRLTRNAELIVGLAQVYVHVHTGNLRDSIHAEVTSTGQKIEVTVSADAGYARFIEAKYPFMAPAVSQVEPQLQADLEAIQQVINENVGK